MFGDELRLEVASEDLTLLAFIASYGLQGADDIGGRRKRKASDGSPIPSDEELAFQLFAEEARALQALASDTVFARSLDRALQADMTLLEEHERTEEVARALAEGRRPAAQPNGPSLSKRSSPPTPATITSATSSTALFAT